MHQTEITPASSTIQAANPAPLGLFGFGLSTLLVSSINAGLIPPESVAAVVPLAFTFGGLAQLVVGILEFRLGDTFGGVSFIAYGMFWWWFSLLQWTLGAGWLKAPAASGMATAFLLWGIFTFILWLITFRLNKVLWSLFLLLTITYFLLAAKDYGMGASFGRIAGYVGLLTGIDAIVLAGIELLNAVAGYTVIPLGAPLVANKSLAGRVGVAL
jgi:hypothetical protein